MLKYATAQTPLANPFESLFEPEPQAEAVSAAAGGQSGMDITDDYSEDAVQAFSLDPGARMSSPALQSPECPCRQQN